MQMQVNQTAPNAGQQPARYARAKEVADYLRVNVSTVWAWCKQYQEFPKPIKAGSKITLFDLNQIDTWVQSRSGGKQ